MSSLLCLVRRRLPLLLCILIASAFARTTAPGHAERGDGADQPARRAAWFQHGRRSLDRLTPVRHLLRAIHQRRGMPRLMPRVRPLRATAPTSTSGNWTQLGPSPQTDTFYNFVSGRVTSLALDPSDSSGNTVYLGAAFGGVWKSTNALSANPTFVPVSDGEPSLSIGSVAVAPNGAVFAATGEQNNGWDSYYGVGILRSTDGGQTWTLASSADAGLHSFLGMSFARIVVDPDNPQVILAAGGSAGNLAASDLTITRGVYRSTDGGATWSLAEAVNPSGGGYTATDVLYEPTQKKFYAAIRGQGLFVSSDLGQTWTALSTPFPSGAIPNFNLSSGVSNFDRASLATRTDAQGNVTLWALMTDDQGAPSSPTPCSPGVTSGCDTGLSQSLDGGKSWTPVAIPNNLYSAQQSSPQGFYDQFIAAPPNSTSLVVGGIDVWSAPTVNGVSTAWTNLTDAYGSGHVHPDQHAIVFKDANTWLIGNDGGIWSTTNGPTVTSTTWNNLNNSGLATIQFLGVTGDPSKAGAYLGGSQDNGLAVSRNAPASQVWDYQTGGDGGYTAINPSNSTQYFGEDANVNIYYSGNSGLPDVHGNSTWHTVVDTSTIKDYSSFYVPFELVPSNPSNLVLGTCRVWRGPAIPVSPGAGWTAISPFFNGSTCSSSDPYIQALAVAPTSADVIYAVTVDQHVEKTTNATTTNAGGPTWTDVTPSGLVPVPGYVASFGAVAVSPTDPNTVYAGVLDFGVKHVWMSTDGGASWTNIDGNLPDAPVNSLLVDPKYPKIVYAGTDVGVFAITDGGLAGASETWSKLGSGLPASAVLDLTMNTTGGSESLVAATHGRGAWTIPALTPGPPDFSLQLSSTSGSVTAGGQLTATLSITPSFGFNQTLQLSCSGVPATITCTPSPASLAPDSNGNYPTSSVTIQTTARGLLPPPLPSGPARPFWLLLALSLLSLWGWMSWPAPAMRRRAFAGAAALSLFLLLTVSCGGGGSSSSGGSTPTGTPAGTSQLTLTAATAAGSSSTVSHSATYSLMVN